MSVFLSAFRSTATGFMLRHVELVRALEEPLGVGELAVGALVENDDAQAEVVVRVVDGGDLLRAVTWKSPTRVKPLASVCAAARPPPG